MHNASGVSVSTTTAQTAVDTLLLNMHGASCVSWKAHDCTNCSDTSALEKPYAPKNGSQRSKIWPIQAIQNLDVPGGWGWNDERMKFLISGTQSTVHDFDGCMYGLKSQFKDVGTAIKKPWRIVSWGVEFFDLHEKCDGSHTHGQMCG